MSSLRDRLAEFQFRFRDQIVGKWKLRSGLPRIAPDSPSARREQAFYELILKRAFPDPAESRFTTVWDVGCRNWSYAPALERFFEKNALLIGVEVDGSRRYLNLYRRRDFAEAHADRLRSKGRTAQFIAKDFRQVQVRAQTEIKTQADLSPKLLFCFFYPFVSEHPCLKWGLPSGFSNFSELLVRASEITNESQAHGKILSLHQGEWELDLALAAFQKVGLTVQTKKIASEEWRGLWPSPHDAFILQAVLNP